MTNQKLTKPKVSLVLVSRNEEQFARQFVEAYKKLTPKPEEVILVDASDDKPPDILKPVVDQLFKIGKSSPGGARNHGVSKATGDIILFTDVDAVPDPDWVEQILKPFEDPKVFVVVGTVKFTEIKPLIPPKTGRLYMNHCNAAYRREVFAKHRMDPRMVYDDQDFGYRVGKDYVIHGQPNAVVLHYGTFVDKAWMFKRGGIGWIRLWFKYGFPPFWVARYLYNLLVMLFVHHDPHMFLWAFYSIFYGFWHECILKDVDSKHLI